jgi:hypothetical protein
MTTPIDAIEDAIVDHIAGRITEADAIAQVRTVLRVTEAGARDLLSHPVSARFRYGVRSGESGD